MFKKHNLIILSLFSLINFNYVNCFVKFNLYNRFIQCHFKSFEENN